MSSLWTTVAAKKVKEDKPHFDCKVRSAKIHTNAKCLSSNVIIKHYTFKHSYTSKQLNLMNAQSATDDMLK